MTMTSSLKNILIFSLLSASSLVSATDLSSLEVDDKATAEEVLAQYQAVGEEKDAETQLEEGEQRLDQENAELLQPLCPGSSVDTTGSEGDICALQ